MKMKNDKRQCGVGGYSGNPYNIQQTPYNQLQYQADIDARFALLNKSIRKLGLALLILTAALAIHILKGMAV